MKLTGALENALTGPAPDIEVFPATPGPLSGTGIVILPGGGYSFLAEHEGRGYAEYFAREGAACFVANYRLGDAGHRHPAMLEDALAAIGTVRRQAARFGVNPACIGIMGSSAGGHLASHALTAYATYRSSVSLRPDFGILCYPVIDMSGPHCNTWSRDNLLGPDQSGERLAEVSSSANVTADTPPCFIWHTWTDDGVPVENSLGFAMALRRHGVSCELHVYSEGGHGLGLNTTLPWGMECVRWLKELATRTA